MRGFAVVVWSGLAGCYAPSVVPGAPCDPTLDNCPRELRCTAGASGFTCERPGAGPPGADAPGDDPVTPIDAATDAPADARPDAMADAMADAQIPLHLTYPSVVADCVARSTPNPDACIAANGTGQLVLDANDSMFGVAWDGYVRFDLDAQVAGRTITSVKLQMTTTDDTKAPSSESGVVWLVGAFTRASLATATPAQIGTQPVAGSQGAVVKNQRVEWPLPPALVTANGHVYLGLVTANDDGVNYWNQTGTSPPVLVVDTN